MLYKEFEIELLDDNSCSIKKYKGKGSSVVVPQEVEVSGRKYTVTDIGKSAFANKDSIGEVRLPETITSIGSNAFKDCRSLREINLPEGLTHIGENALEGTYPDLGNILYANKTKMYRWLGDSLFNDCIEVPEGVTEIDPYAFHTVYVEKVVLPSTLKKIGDFAFKDCTCKEINLPDGLTEIGKGAFNHCYNLRNIVIPAGIKVIKEKTFELCNRLEKVKFQQGLEKIEEDAFTSCERLASVKLPKGVEVDKFAFSKTVVICVSAEEQKQKLEKCTDIDTEDLYVILAPYMMKLIQGVPYVGNEFEEGQNIFLFHTYDDAKEYMVAHDFEAFDNCYLIGHLDPSSKFSNLRNIFKCVSKLGVTHYLLDGKSIGNISDFLDAKGEDVNSYSTTYDEMSDKFETLRSLGKEVNEEEDNEEEDYSLSQMMKLIPVCGIPIMNYTYPFTISKERQAELERQYYDAKTLDELGDIISNNRFHENCEVLSSIEFRLMMQMVPRELALLIPIYTGAIWMTAVTNQPRFFLMKIKENGELMMKALPKSDKKLIYVAFTDIHKHQFQALEFNEIKMVDLSTILEENSNIVGVCFCDMAGIEANVDRPGWLRE